MSGEAAKKAGLPAMRAFSASRPVTLGGAVTSAGLGLSGGEDEAEAQAQVPRDTSNLDRNRPFDVEAFSEAFPELAAEMRQRPLDETQRSYDEQYELRRQQEAERQRKKERGGIMSRLSNFTTSPEGQSFLGQLQDLAYAGGAARGQEGAQILAARQARQAKDRELQALEDKITLDREVLDVTRQTSFNELMTALLSDGGFQAEITRLAAEMDLPRDDPKVQSAALQSWLGALNLQGITSPLSDVGGMGGLDGPTRNELEEYTATP
jgi:hypothetical protein